MTEQEILKVAMQLRDYCNGRSCHRDCAFVTADGVRGHCYLMNQHNPAQWKFKSVTKLELDK